MATISRGEVYSKGGHILNPGDIVGVKYVTVIGYARDFAVYMGLSEWADREVATSGDKVLEETARQVAPYCSHLEYRY